MSILLPSVGTGKAMHRGVFARITVRQGQGLQHRECIWNSNLGFYLLSLFFFHWFQTQSTMFALSAAFLLLVAHTCDLILME